MDSDSDEDLRELCKLHNAAETGDEEALRAILLETRQQSEAVAAQLASAQHTLGSPEATVRQYIQQAVNSAEIDGLTALHLALCNGHFGCAKVLLDHGADAEHSCEGSFPPHIVAALSALPTFKETCVQAMQMLLAHGLTAYSEDDNSRTALHWAAASDHAQLCSMLMAAGEREASAAAAAASAELSVGGEDTTGTAPGVNSHAVTTPRASTPLGSSMDADSPTQPPLISPTSLHASPMPPSMKPLISVADDRGNTALHVAARDACQSALRELISAAAAAGSSAAASGSAPTANGGDGHAPATHPALLHRNKSGQTPLHCAVLGGSAACVSALLEAAPTAAQVADRLGATPAQLAATRHVEPEILQLMGVNDDAVNGGAGAGDGGEPSRAGAAQPVLLVTSPDCLAHHTAKPPLLRGASVPPENIRRLEVLVDRRTGILRSNRFTNCTWMEDCHPVAMTDVLRVHTWKYVRTVREACAATPEDGGTRHLDSDTTVSRGSFRAALKAAGAVCLAIDEVVSGRTRKAFCAVRPPGHHAGPYGMVPGRPGTPGSHGFCLLNNIAIGAAYAVSTHRHAGIRRVALLDFDVHHGNGTEECVFNTVPNEVTRAIDTSNSDGVERFLNWRPWFDGDDRRNILFASVQGYGPRSRGGSDYLYPGSGPTADNAALSQALPGVEAAEHPESDMCVYPPKPAQPPTSREDPQGEFTPIPGFSRPRDGPRVINVGIPGPGVKANLWRRSWRDKILPAVANFAPDLILISAGFDAHRKDDINLNFVGVREHDYAWVTDQIVQLANRVCKGRVVSVLEGGYRVQGQVVSAFARSVAAHVGALAEPNGEVWSNEAAAAEREVERRERERRMELKERRAAARMESGLGALGAFARGDSGCMGCLSSMEAAGVGGAAAAAAAAGAAAAAADGDALAVAGFSLDHAMDIEADAMQHGLESGLSTGLSGALAVDDVFGQEERQGRAAGAPVAPARAAATGDGSAATAVAGQEVIDAPVQVEEGGHRSKRARRGPVPDYVSLNRELEQQAAHVVDAAAPTAT